MSLGEVSSAMSKSVLERIKESTLEGFLGQRESSGKSHQPSQSVSMKGSGRVLQKVSSYKASPQSRSECVPKRVRESIMEGLLRKIRDSPEEGLSLERERQPHKQKGLPSFYKEMCGCRCLREEYVVLVEQTMCSCIFFLIVGPHSY